MRGRKKRKPFARKKNIKNVNIYIKNSFSKTKLCGYKNICVQSPYSSFCHQELWVSCNGRSPGTRTARQHHKQRDQSLTHIRGIALGVFRLQVVQHIIPGFGKQIQVSQKHCLLPIYCVRTDDAGCEFATIAQLKYQGGMLVSNGFRAKTFHSDVVCVR